ncbi:MAG: hypothetical protein Q9195_002514 [Heterodermia aff. obscurata]
MFNNDVLSRREAEPDSRSTQHNDSGGDHASRRDQKTAKICQTLLSLFPQPELEDQLLKSSYWWHPWHQMFPMMFGIDENTTSFREFVLEAKASRNVQRVAKALLCLLLTLQESKGFDEYLQDHGMTTYSLTNSDSQCGRKIEKSLKVINKLVLADDELAGTIDGIECLSLLSKHDSNQGRIRRAWICTRRGLFFSQLLGLHRRSKTYAPEVAQRRESLWKAVYQADRFMSLILGLPYGSATHHCEMDMKAKPTGSNYAFRMAHIAGDVLDRNLSPSPDGNYMETIKIESSIMDLANSMPPDWWRYELVDGEDTTMQMYERLLPQFWHHQVRTLLHLPFMLKAGQDRRYEYNRIAALESAREMIARYQVVRPVQGYQSLICKVIDFQVFTAAMVLILNLFDCSAPNSKHNEEEDDRDWDLLTSTNEILQHASKATGGVVASQAARALGMFVQSRNVQCAYKPESSFKVVIPCFGTVSFGLGKDFARQRATTQTPSVFSQSAGLPTPSDSYTGSTDDSLQSKSDPFVSFDSYLAQMPFDFNLNGETNQQLGLSDTYAFTDVNLDVDQDWAWYPPEQQSQIQ